MLNFIICIKEYRFLILIIFAVFMIFWALWKFFYWSKKDKKIIKELKNPILKIEDFIKKFATSGRKEAEPESMIEEENGKN